MSTANFHNINARFIYARSLEDSEQAEWDCIDELSEAFRTAAADPREKAFHFYMPEGCPREVHGLRGYPGQVITTIKSPPKTYRDFEFVIVADIILRLGYYADANLDYDLYYELDGISCEDDTAAVCDLRDALETIGYGADKREHYVGLLRNWLARHQPAFIDAIEQVFARHSTPLRCIGTASNGEAFYRPVKQHG